MVQLFIVYRKNVIWFEPSKLTLIMMTLDYGSQRSHFSITVDCQMAQLFIVYRKIVIWIEPSKLILIMMNPDYWMYFTSLISIIRHAQTVNPTVCAWRIIKIRLVK